MANNNEGFVQVDNNFIDSALPKLSANSVKCMLVIYRETIGWQKKSVELSTEKLLEKTGISNKKTVHKAVKELKDFGLLEVKKSEGKPSIYTIKAVPKIGTTTKKRYHQKTVLLPVPKIGTAPSIYKEIEIKEREEEFFSEEEKKKFIAYLMQNEDIKNPKGFERSLRSKIHNKDPATIEMFLNWREEEKTKQQIEALKDNFIVVQLKDTSEIRGTIFNIETIDEGYLVCIVDNNEIKHRVKADSLDAIRKYITKE